MGPKAGARDRDKERAQSKVQQKKWGIWRKARRPWSVLRPSSRRCYRLPSPKFAKSSPTLPHDRESGLGAISREWRDAIVAHGARGRADDGDRVERCIRFEHICSVLGVFAGGACVPRSFFFLSETFGVGARDLSLLSGRESAARKKNTRLTFFSLPFLYRSCTMPPAFVSTPDDKRKF